MNIQPMLDNIELPTNPSATSSSGTQSVNSDGTAYASDHTQQEIFDFVAEPSNN